MNILSKLSIKNLKLNKKRSISTIIAIILSVSLICGTASLATSFQRTLVNRAISETGYYHLKIGKVTDNDIERIENNRDIKNTFTLIDKGYSKFSDENQNKDKPYLHLYSMKNDTFTNLNFKLIEGNFPQNSNEIVISDHISTNAKVNLKIGDIISLDIGKRKTLDGYELNQSNPYNKELEEIVDSAKYDFKIVGIMKRPDYTFENRGDPGYTIITTGLNEEEKDIYIALKDPKEYKTSITELMGAKQYSDVVNNTKNLKYDNYAVNTELLKWEVFAFSDSTVAMLYSVVTVLIFVIIFTSVFCIRNSFAISITEKIKMYGMLASVGATRKQIRKNVIFEGFILGIIGIPIGILSGIVAVAILVNIVNIILGEVLFGVDIAFYVSLFPIIISVILGGITIYLSSISSARRASKVSPIEQLRSSNDIKIKRGKLKTPKIISSVFKTGGTLAYKNLKRSRKKYRTTVISLAVSIFVFITMNAFITNAFDISSDYYYNYDYNILIYNGTRSLSDEDLDKIQKLDNINNIYKYYTNVYDSFKIYDLSKINEDDIFMPLAEETYYDKEKDEVLPTGKGKVANLSLIALDDETFKNYVKKLNLNYDKVKTSGILCDECQYYDSNSKNTKVVRKYKYSKNDTIEGEFKDNTLKIKIGDITNIMPYGLERTFYDDGFLVVNKSEYEDLDFTLRSICIDSSNPDELENDIKKINSDLSISNLDKMQKENRSYILVINIFLYGFIAVITLIGVTNIFNTITSNMELRQKEFAMLKSIGMTKKEFNRMINLETIFYSVKALIYGIILGLLGTYALYKAFSVKIDKGIYIPINPIIISIVFVFILVFIIMKYSMSKINKQNIIETIRKENI